MMIVGLIYLQSFLTITEVARVLNKDRHTISRWLQRGKMLGVQRVGNMALIPEAEVKRLQEETSCAESGLNVQA